jgi:hypothetical protein
MHEKYSCSGSELYWREYSRVPKNSERILLHETVKTGELNIAGNHPMDGIKCNAISAPCAQKNLFIREETTCDTYGEKHLSIQRINTGTSGPLA